MNLSANTRNAIQILSELEDAGNPLPIGKISERTGIQYRAVENVHLILKQYGVTGSVAGGKGGLVLRQPLETISLGHLLSWFEGGDVVLTENKPEQNGKFKNRVRTMLDDLALSMEERLNSVLLAAVRKEFLSTSLAALGSSCRNRQEAAELYYAEAGRFHPIHGIMEQINFPTTTD